MTEQRAHAVHLCRTLGHPLLVALEVDRARGLDTRVVMIHDAAVFAEHLEGPAARERHAWCCLADDCRRRGLLVPDDAIDYDELVDLIAGAERVVSW